MQQALIRKPIAIRVYQFGSGIDSNYRIEHFSYHRKKEEPIALLDTYTCWSEEEVIAYTNELKKIFDVRDFYRFYEQDEEVQYEPHSRLQLYVWSTIHLEDIFNQHIRQTYGYDASISVEYDLYGQNFAVNVDLNDTEEGYEALAKELLELYITEQEKEKHPKRFTVEQFEFDLVWRQILSEIVGKKLVSFQLENQSHYLGAEQQWINDDTIKAIFFFEQ